LFFWGVDHVSTAGFLPAKTGGDAFDRIDQSLEAARASQKVWSDDGMPLGSFLGTIRWMNPVMTRGDTLWSLTEIAIEAMAQSK
jgi:hypothetical protein